MADDEKQEWFNIQEVADLLNTPSSSVRRYVGQFSMYLRMKKKGNKNLIHQESIETLKKIRFLYEDQKNTEEIIEILSKKIPATMEGTIVSEDDSELVNEIKNLTDKINGLESFIQEKFVAYEERDKALMERINTRDKMLMEAIRNTMELKRMQIESAATMEQTNHKKEEIQDKKRWWHIFGKKST